MKSETCKVHQWFVYEMKICRTVVGITQVNFAKLIDLSVDKIKLFERKGSLPNQDIKQRIRNIFNFLGVQCKIDNTAITVLTLHENLVQAINEGKQKDYCKSRYKLFIDQKSKNNYEKVLLSSFVKAHDVQLIDYINPSNQWLMLEVKLYRIISGLSQQLIADSVDLKLLGYKQLEKGGNDTRCRTYHKLKKLYDYMGIRCDIDDFGNITTKLRKEFIKKINTGEHDTYREEMIQKFNMASTLVKFE